LDGIIGQLIKPSKTRSKHLILSFIKDRMKIGILANFQHSFFSNGCPTLAFSLAEALQQFGHEPILININGNSEWYDDVQELKSLYPRKNFLDIQEPLDIIIDIDGYLNPSERRRVAKKVVIFLRKPMFLLTLEATVYSMNLPIQSFDCDAIWTWDGYGEQDSHLIEVLTKKPVFRIPFTWSSKAVDEYSASHPSWMDSSVGKDTWEPHVLETNTTMASNCTVTFVGLGHAKSHTKAVFKKAYIHNVDRVEPQQFFKDNVLAHSKRDGLEFEFVGRIRTADLRRISKTVILSHMRFLTIKGVLLDSIWSGIPVIHNSLFLKNLGHGLDRFYYNDNSIVGMTTAFDALEEDYKTNSGFFKAGNLLSLRALIQKSLDPYQHKDKWEAAINLKAQTIKPKTEYTVGFSDLWDEANPEYNFWTLLLNDAGKHLGITFKGVKATPETPIDLLIFGPFGTTWKTINNAIPKFHTTGENSPFIPEVMNFGFRLTGPNSLRFPLWMQYIDWFGADQELLRNPKTLPIDSVCKPHPITKRNKFCAFIVTNPTNQIRNQAFQVITQYKPVDSAGRLFNNVGDCIFTKIPGGGSGELIKHKFLQDYKFSITYENTSAPGYVTEKLLAAKAAGCIPIYWGAPDVEMDFPRDSFLNVNCVSDGNILIEKIRALDMDDEAYNKMASIPPVDSNKARSTLSQVAKCILERILDSNHLSKLPTMLGASSTAELQLKNKTVNDLPKTVNLITVSTDQKLTKPTQHKWNNKTLLVTFATQKYVESLGRWIVTLSPRLNDNIKARVYLGNDIDTMTQNLLKSQNPYIEFYKLPEMKVTNFPDIWEPQHFAWKLWIYQELVQQQDLQNTLIWYMDCASVIVRWPTEWFAKAAEAGICMLEDPQQKNDQWCQPSFCNRLMVTPQELAQQQVVGGIMAFIGGAVLPWKVFTEAWVLAQQRDIIVGPKWSGQLPDGRPYGHRHDQSILSLLRLRRNVPTYPLYSVYCDESLRRTFKSGAALYIHRGQFKENVNFAPRIGEVHIINLARRKDRLQRFKDNHPWSKNVCLRPAYDGLNLTLTPALTRLFSSNDFKWKKSIAGCALSHLSLWAELADEQPSCENYLILEDDVKFKSDWMNIWQEAAKEIPEDYDVLYLGGVLPPNKAMFTSVLEPVNSKWSKIMPNQLFGQKTPTPYFHFCNYSYILSRKGAQKILDAIKANGIYTSGDHMICNRMDMKHYVLTPLVAGCYQDDDPKYQSSEFNNFNRVDAFDSDLWNNDERFTEEDIKLNMTDTLVNIKQVFNDINVINEPQTKSKSLYTIGDCKLVKGSLLEYDWLNMLLGGRLDTSEQVSVDHPLLDSPIFAVMKPHFKNYLEVFKRYSEAKKPFYVLHISDEHCNDPIDWYSSCEHVYRIYSHPKTVGLQNVTQLPLGPYRTTTVNSPLHKRTQVWSFYGTSWMDRNEAMKPLLQLQPNTCVLYNSWMDANQLSSAEYSEQCLKSMFMPCPHGNNVETFRLWEALEHGCIPIYVAKQNDLFAEYISKNLPIIILDSWVSAQQFMITLLKKPEMLAEYRMKLLTAWVKWKQNLVITI